MSLLNVTDLHIPDLLGPLSFKLDAGESLGIIGESGSGKTLTALSAMGLLPQNLHAEGSILFQDEELIGMSDKQARTRRGTHMAMVFQEPMTALDPLMRIDKQLRYAGVKDITAALEEVDLNPKLRRRFPHELSGGQRQRVLIAMAMARRPELLICDEPTTALDATTQAEILRVLKQVTANHGTALLFISHDLRVIHQMCPEVLVMQNGHIVEAGSTDDILHNPQHDYTQKLVAASRAKDPAAAPQTSDAIIRLREVSKTFGNTTALEPLTLDIPQGARLGIVGSSGSGKTTLLKLIAGLETPTSGDITVNGRVQMVFQDPQGSLNPRLPIWKSIAEPLGGTPSGEARRKVAAILEEVGIPADAMDRFPHEFSGGQRQRISIARAVIAEPNILLADEAVSALDVSVRAQVLDLLTRLVEAHGLTLVFISHDLAVVRQVCHSLVVVHAGHVVETGPTEEIWNNPHDSYTQQLLAAATKE
ncbi:ATPase component of various ABC-type transport systems with duplicated ATPase domain [Corynebacterium camporealensis]|uniref:ATPase component of various ABC-type transport systems with duplicated ATPase domain n=1 Tax=Corynebacterium camporealensis TaxID=161896 RepID=A0A0F6TBS6_9CORY|nr:ABC transporter ATP-binding protein [Corynebacterium camporealensis]AKE39676.1 ATPase component of various ABC-type transport systems with duplicated ATPase domain [Corynebacterium camporealensis]AVH88805.1 ATPase component of various ABC-type transport systems with duplicated ATPase domain [Corynebacterium camporealensis]